MVTGQNTYAPPPLPNGAQWSPSAVPVRFNPTTRGWEMFANGQWLPRAGMTFEQVNAMGRAGQAFQVDFAASGGQANMAAVQRELAPRVFAADNAQLSPEGAILAPGRPNQAVATQQRPDPRVFAPDGARLSDQGSILPLPSPPPAAPVQAERGNNPNAVYNPQTNTWNVDPAAQQQAVSPQTMTAQSPPKRQPEDLTGVTPPAPRDPSQPPTREQQWLEYLLGSSPAMNGGSVQGETPAFNHGGYRRPRYAEGGAQGPLPMPDAIVGEGLESQTPQFDTPERSELTLEPMPNLGPDIFKVRVAEGPTGVQADGGMLVLPLSEPAAMIAREHLRPAEGLKGKMNGSQFESGPLSLPTTPGPNGAPTETPALATGGVMDDQGFSNGGLILLPGVQPPPGQQPQTPGDFTPVPGAPQPIRGIHPPPSLLGPSEEWQGFPGGLPPPIGNLTEFARTSDAQRQRLDQMLKANGILGGIQAVEADLRRSSPGRLSLPTSYG